MEEEIQEEIKAETKKETLTKETAKSKTDISVKRKVDKGRIYIFSSYNNTIITLTDSFGKVLGWVSTGSVGFRGKKQATYYAGIKAAEALMEKVRRIGIKDVEIFLKGIGIGRGAALKFFSNEKDLNFIAISDITPIPHNGCRPPKLRRL
jgi:small subunit ribosomal protein S11